MEENEEAYKKGVVVKRGQKLMKKKAYSIWHLNVTVCSHCLGNFAASLSLLPPTLSFHPNQTGADAGNGTEALSEALEMGNKSQWHGVELKATLSQSSFF